MKHLTRALVLIWLAQGAVCLLPGLTHAHGELAAVATTEDAGHAAHGHHGTPEPAEGRAPAPEGSTGCEQHCASLTQALSPALSVIPWTVALWLSLPPVKMQLVAQRIDAKSLDSHHGPPPRDVVIANASLLI